VSKIRDKVKNKKALRRTVIVPASEEDARTLGEAREEYTRAVIQGGGPAARGKLKAIEDEVAERGFAVTFRGIGRPAFEALRRTHQPTAEQKAESSMAMFNVDTFPAALCAASEDDSSPMTEQEWLAQVFQSSEFNTGELGAIFNAAQSAQTDSQVVELGN
jgi:hypothetical protein